MLLKTEKIVFIAYPEGWQLTYHSVCQYLYILFISFTLKPVSDNLCLALRLCGRVSCSISKLRGNCWFVYLCCSLHWDTSEWAGPRSCEDLRSGVCQAHLDQPLPERAATSSFGLGSLEENLALALPWSHPSEFPMTVSSKGPNSA